MFYCVLVRFVGQMTKNSKFWAMSRVLRPTPQLGREGGFFHPRVRRGEATVHSMEMLCFCFVLFFCCSENLSIGLIRTL